MLRRSSSYFLNNFFLKGATPTTNHQYFVFSLVIGNFSSILLRERVRTFIFGGPLEPRQLAKYIINDQTIEITENEKR